eukprot:NODE_18163_length_907_cov_3.042308.p1 GENE.NODE_18163_length_907_cov_3.042308~~NODE_18163_length_907_cov_3.042308.p1  ORF type:complete len:297 (+),score=54.67 NODE_18163_length_907_cov_3.042308:2-892(+)
MNIGLAVAGSGLRAVRRASRCRRRSEEEAGAFLSEVAPGVVVTAAANESAPRHEPATGEAGCASAAGAERTNGPAPTQRQHSTPSLVQEMLSAGQEGAQRGHLSSSSSSSHPPSQGMPSLGQELGQRGQHGIFLSQDSLPVGQEANQGSAMRPAPSPAPTPALAPARPTRPTGARPRFTRPISRARADATTTTPSRASPGAIARPGVSLEAEAAQPRTHVLRAASAANITAPAGEPGLRARSRTTLRQLRGESGGGAPAAAAAPVASGAAAVASLRRLSNVLPRGSGAAPARQRHP